MDFYSPTSEARQPLWNKPTAQPRPKKVKKEKKAAKPKLEYRNVGQTSKAFSLLSLVTLVLLFAAALGIVMSFAIVADQANNIRSLTAELRQIEEDNNLIRTQIAQSYDIREIERIASQRLMMSRPQPHQVVHIYVPSTSHTVTNIQATPEEPSRAFWDLRRLFD